MPTRFGSRSAVLSRRRFLRGIALISLAGTAGGVLAGCATARDESVPAQPTRAPQPIVATEVAEAVAPTGEPAPTSEPGSGDAPTTEPIAQATAPASDVPVEEPVPAQPAYLAVARGPSPEAITRAVIDELGGMRRFVSQGDDVIIKPNICVAYHTYEYAATTNPVVVGTLTALALDAGAKRVRVMDYPFGGTPDAAYEKSGIADAVKQAGGKMEVMSLIKFQEVDIPQGRDLKSCKVYTDALDADVLIDVPVAKHHSMAGLTLAMKNLMGLIESRPAIHRNFRQRIPDLATLFQPALTVVDAVRILTNHGPTGGNLDDVKLTNTVVASHDIVAADAYAATLFGKAPTDIAYIEGGAEAGLGTLDLDAIDSRELDI